MQPVPQRAQPPVTLQEFEDATAKYKNNEAYSPGYFSAAQDALYSSATAALVTTGTWLGAELAGFEPNGRFLIGTFAATLGGTYILARKARAFNYEESKKPLNVAQKALKGATQCNQLFSSCQAVLAKTTLEPAERPDTSAIGWMHVFGQQEIQGDLYRLDGEFLEAYRSFNAVYQPLKRHYKTLDDFGALLEDASVMDEPSFYREHGQKSGIQGFFQDARRPVNRHKELVERKIDLLKKWRQALPPAIEQLQEDKARYERAVHVLSNPPKTIPQKGATTSS